MSFSVGPSDKSETRAPLLGASYGDDSQSSRGPENDVHPSFCDTLLSTWKFVLGILTSLLLYFIPTFWVDFMKTMVCRLAAFLAVIFPTRQTPVTSQQEQRLRDLWLRVQIPFDENNDEHNSVLQELWKAAFPDTPWSGRRSKNWSQMGWQGLDPITDLRGAGFLALECLLDLNKRDHHLFRKLMEKSDGMRSEWEYPFAVAGVNITFELIQTFQLRDIEKLPSTSYFKGFLNLLDGNENIFEDLFGVMFELLDKNWLEQKASYMEFPMVMKKTRNQMEEVLSTMPSDIEEIRTLLGL